MNSRSFKIGSVRKLSQAQEKKIWKLIGDWVQEQTREVKRPIMIVGTGGNIKKLYQISSRSYNRTISLAELMGVRAYVAEFDSKERIHHLRLNPDRADVIIPASNIYIHIAQIAKADNILVPSVGLKDGLIYHLYSRFAQVDIRDVEFVNLFEE
jgi:exopolyphosphatase/guanosine-5'-triphosphate,3'-diphosphate pyrophosphatase